MRCTQLSHKLGPKFRHGICTIYGAAFYSICRTLVSTNSKKMFSKPTLRSYAGSFSQDFKQWGGQIVSRGLCLSGSWYNDHSQHLQHPEPSESFSQDFNRPIQAMMNPVVF